MDNAVLMRLLQSLRDLSANLKNLINRQRALRQAIGESLALQVFHYQKVGAVLCADVVKRADIRVLERRNSSSLALHPLLQFRVRGKMGGQNLDGNGAVKTRIPGAIHLAHTARTQRTLNFIRTEFRARDQGHQWAQL